MLIWNAALGKMTVLCSQSNKSFIVKAIVDKAFIDEAIVEKTIVDKAIVDRLMPMLTKR